MLRAQAEDMPTDLCREPTVPLDFRRAEEAGHPLVVEARRLSVEGALRGAGLLRAFRRGLTEENDGTNQLIQVLLRERGEQMELLPVVGRFVVWAQARRHGFPAERRTPNAHRVTSATEQHYVESRAGMIVICQRKCK